MYPLINERVCRAGKHCDVRDVDMAMIAGTGMTVARAHGAAGAGRQARAGCSGGGVSRTSRRSMACASIRPDKLYEW